MDTKTIDQMELLRRLIVLVGSGNCSGQTAAVQLLSGNPALSVPTNPLFTDHLGCGASTALPFTESAQNQAQTAFASLLNNVSANECIVAGVSSKTASTSNIQNSRPEIDDLESFAQHFKKQRIKLGYTQGDVGLALGRKYGTDFSQTTISRFETSLKAMNLSFKNMCKLRPLLKEWLEGQEAAMANGTNVDELRNIDISKDKMEDCMDELSIHRPTSVEPLMKRRRKRTNLDLTQRKSLDNFFLANPRPGHEEMVRIANALDLERDVVRVWFCNRRQKLRRTEDLFPMIDSSCRAKVATKSYSIVLAKEVNNGDVMLETAETTNDLCKYENENP
ncbi:Pou domain - to homeobox domain protein [Dictyocaulus viviparus]|uniref:Pou domain-to homeobox domain protein n=1 Tax=Dictyocaulus viviparus TaxID=29172 RepID=A0A0D8XEA9_DICVI|nr:Pou domain - to homeobox domain protein [Dictyocaulus viviparus]